MSTVERAAEAMHALGNSDPWERQHEYVRQEFRDDARATLSAAIDVDEMARVIGSVHKRETETYGQYDRRRARTVRNYLTGDESDE